MTPIAEKMPGLYYVTGDVTKPQSSRPLVIAHMVNNIGAWGAGFTKSLDRWSPVPRMFYKAWSRDIPEQHDELRSGLLVLGHVQLVVSANLEYPVANLCAQHDIRRNRWGAAPIRYDALRTAFDTLHTLLTRFDGFRDQACSQVHMPRIGAGLAGGDWDLIEPIIKSTIAVHRCVVVYDLPSRERACSDGRMV